MASYSDGPSEGRMVAPSRGGQEEVEPEGLTRQQDLIGRGLQDLQEAVSVLRHRLEPVMKSNTSEDEKHAAYAFAGEPSKDEVGPDFKPSDMTMQAQGHAQFITQLMGQIHELRYRLDF